MKFFLISVVFFVGFIALGGLFMTKMPGASFQGALPALTEDEKEIADRLQNHVEMLANDIGVRSATDTSRLGQAQAYLENVLRREGLRVEEQIYQSANGAGKNLVAELAGSARHKEVVIIGAHIDSAKKCPGANANASGCAVLLELARALTQGGVNRTVRFVAFDRGEAPFAGTENSGSYAYAKRCKEKGETVVAMLSLDSLGYYSTQPGSQSCPFPLNCFFPDKGNFVAFAGDSSSRDLVQKLVELFRIKTRFPAEGASLPGWIPSLRSSDQAGFWDHGYPAVVITDTGTLRSPYNGTASDTRDRLDYNSMARVTAGLSKVVAELANKQALSQ